MNYGKIIGWTMVVLSIGASVGYAKAGDHRNALYFLFAACINATIVY